MCFVQFCDEEVMSLSIYFFVSFHKEVKKHASYFLSILAMRTSLLLLFFLFFCYNDTTRPSLGRFLVI